MKPIELAEVKDIAEYERIRPALRARVIALKNDRRIAVGPHITFLFENRETVLAQVQEMMRAERIVHEDKIQHELDTYNRLLPDDGELSATMFIEVTDPGRIRQELARLLADPAQADRLIADLRASSAGEIPSADSQGP